MSYSKWLDINGLNEGRKVVQSLATDITHWKAVGKRILFGGGGLCFLNRSIFFFSLLLLLDMEREK